MPSETDPRPGRRPLRIGIALALAVGAAVPILRLVNRRVPAPEALGLEDGRLRACPGSPNCIGSEDPDVARRAEPLPFMGTRDETRARLCRIVAALPGTRLVQERPDCLHYEFRTRVLGFVDDVEFRFDAEARVVHVRSASRVGYSDLGVNRRRIEHLREAWRAASNAG